MSFSPQINTFFFYYFIFKFCTTFLVKSGINFKTDGTYSIKAHYGEAEKVITFDFHKHSDIETVLENKSIIKHDDELKTITKNTPIFSKDNLDFFYLLKNMYTV